MSIKRRKTKHDTLHCSQPEPLLIHVIVFIFKIKGTDIVQLLLHIGLGCKRQIQIRIAVLNIVYNF